MVGVGGQVGRLNALVHGSAHVVITSDTAVPGLRDMAPWDPARQAQLWTDRVAVVDVDRGKLHTFNDLERRALSVAGWLHAQGVDAGDRVAVLSHNGVHLLDLLYACARLRAILVPWNWRLHPRELAALASETDPALVFSAAEFEDMARVVAPTRTPIVLDGSAGRWGEVVNCTDAAPDRVALLSDPWLILFTGGTTGTPKGAVLTRGSITWNNINTTASWGLGYEDSGAAFLPAFHTGFWNVFTLPLLFVGGRVLITERFDAAVALRVLVDERPTICFMVPTMFQLLSERPEFEQADLGSLRWAISGGAPLPAPVYERWRTKVPVFKQGYGLTEVGPNNFATPDAAAASKPGSVGRLTYFAQARIVNSAGEDVPDGDPGEILLAGPHMFAGYWRRPEATAAAIRDGWFHTGDIGRRDNDGYHYIVDRKKDMLITGGENVFPSEVERVLYSHAAVEECVVVGLDDPVWGDAITAVLVLKPGATAGGDDLRTHMRQHLARYKVPKHFVFVDELPKTPAGKVSRVEARVLANDAISLTGAE